MSNNTEVEIIDVAKPKVATSHQARENLPVLESNVSALNLFNPEELEKARVLVLTLVRSKNCNISSVEDGITLLVKAKELGIPFTSAIEHVTIQNGKTSIDVHLIKALLLRAGVTWEKVNDYSPQYEYTDGFNVYVDGNFPDYVKRCRSITDATEKQEKETGDVIYVYPVSYYKDLNGYPYPAYLLTNKHKVVTNKVKAQTAQSEGFIPVFRVQPMPKDYIVTYKLTRVVCGKTMISKSSFTYSDAVTAELVEKDTYKKYAKVLISHRAFALGARDIASDLLLGCLETTELKIINNSTITEEEFKNMETV